MAASEIQADYDKAASYCPADASFYAVRGEFFLNNKQNEKSLAATARYMEIAAELGISVATLATAWSKSHDFVASTIVGVTHADQVADILAAADLTLDAATMKKIDAVSKEIMYPMG